MGGGLRKCRIEFGESYMFFQFNNLFIFFGLKNGIKVWGFREREREREREWSLRFHKQEIKRDSFLVLYFVICDVSCKLCFLFSKKL